MVILPNSLVLIGERAFMGCESLERVVIPNSVKYINDQAFFCCPNLKRVTIPYSVRSIGNDAFFCCYNLEIEVAKAVFTIGEGAFNGCKEVIYY
jgi:hypothetical protein